jgi:predicted dehydrogenase
MPSRRKFIGQSLTLSLGMGLASGTEKTFGSITPLRFGLNDKLRVGAIGINGMGWAVLSSLLKANPDTVCTALCDVDANVLSKKSAELEKGFGMKAAGFGDYRKMLEDKSLDAVVIGTPDHWHCLQMVEACQAGKHVYVEKPAGNSIGEVRRMVAAQKRTGKVVQVGQWQRSNAHFKSALEFLQSGKLGRIRMVKSWAFQGWMDKIPVKPDGPVPPGVDYDLWLGPAKKRPFNPNRFHFNFRWFWDYAGGLMTDWGVHLVDYALLGMNAKDPVTVMASGGKMAYPDDAAETPDTLATVYDFGDFILMWEHAQAINNGNYGKDHGIAYIGNNGTLVLDRGGWKVIPEGKSMEPVEEVKRSDDGLGNHTRNFVSCIRNGNPAGLAAPIEAGATVAEVCQMGNIAHRTCRKLRWDSKTRRFDDKDANGYFDPTYHNGFKLPSI